EVHVFVTHDGRHTVHDAEARVHLRHPTQRSQHREADEVSERHLAAAGAREVVVQDLTVDLEQLRRNGSHRRGGRYTETRFHVGDDARRRAAQRLRRLALEYHGHLPITARL